jgi:hypothetical protein
MVTLQILVLPLGVRIPLIPAIWFLRLSVRTGDSQSSKRGSIPLGTIEVPAQWAGIFIVYYVLFKH